MNARQLESKAVGALLGTFTGDALGRPVEGYTAEMIESRFGRVEDLYADTGGCAYYTDDTELMIGVAESLVSCEGFDGADMAKRFVANFHPHRGYGGGAMEVIYRLSQGMHWQTAARDLFGGGSFGNGGAMRIAPVGVLYANAPEMLVNVAIDTARITHAHPLGIGGAVVQAMAVALAFRSDPAEALDVPQFLRELQGAARPDWDAYKHMIGHIGELLEQGAGPDKVARVLGTNVTAQRSVPTAIFAFLLYPDNYKDCTLYAVNLGGDTDTIGAMSGALSGARLGVDGIPVEWRTRLENAELGRDYVEELGRRLFRISLKIAK